MADEEGDPDWLVAFKAPSTATVMLSDSSPENSPKRTAPPEEKKNSSDCAGTSSKHEEGPSMEEKQDKPPKRVTPKKKTKVAGTKDCLDKRNDTLEQLEDEVNGEKMQDKLAGNSVSQRLPLILSDKVQRSKALVECDGDSIDLSGDIGAVGRIVISNSPTGNQDLLLDLKGTVYKSTIVPSRTFCVVSMGQTEAKIEAIMNDFIQLEPHSNLFEAETMMEGTLDGFTFDSDGEGDRLHELHASQNDPNNENEDQPKAKTKRKAAAKPAAKGQKKAKVAKKGAKKTQSTKRGKKAKK
ncbi:DNA-binding protein BIN4-like isoform X1 [Lolium rigidum]|uniref:DNA-binding protein BIN4-like isoform X1 n=1 Tax=Lolium rigidum TaxID=89674 RepID=UPI001F5CA4BA|nr:DNA-binding protein BIN4-like isoform X1 [Lolium rigidum]